MEKLNSIQIEQMIQASQKVLAALYDLELLNWNDEQYLKINEAILLIQEIRKDARNVQKN